MTEINYNEFTDAVEKLRETKKQYGELSSKYKELEEKTQGIIDKQEEQNQKLIAEMEKARKSEEEQKEVIKKLEKEILNIGFSKDSKHVTPEKMAYRKALCDFINKGKDMLSDDSRAILRTGLPEHKDLLRLDDNVSGGFLTEIETWAELIRKITEISPVRQVSRVMNVSKISNRFPKIDELEEAYYEGEAQPAQEEKMSTGSETLTCHRLTYKTRYTKDLSMDAIFALDTILTDNANLAFAQKEGAMFVNGDANQKPEGFMTISAIEALATESSSAIISGTTTGGWKVLLDMTGELKVGYNAMFGMNRTTLAKVRQYEDTAGNPVWQAGLAPGIPNTIGGERYVVFQDMDDIGSASSNNLPIVYGDFMRGYRIIDRVGMVMGRDEITGMDSNVVKLVFHLYNHGQVVLNEAFQYLKITS